MKIETFKVGKANGKVTCYLQYDLSGVCETNRLRPAILLIPGGGYRFVSPREAEPVAYKFLAFGFSVFILEYSCGENILINKPVFEAAEAMCEIKSRAEEFSIDKDKICVMGFSAGGHLALSLASLSCNKILNKYKGCKPSCAALIYPVVTSGKYAHKGSFDNLCQSEEERAFYSLENRIGPAMVPTFIVHAADDQSVSVENSLMLSSALSRYSIPFELHIYPHGGHGFSTATKNVGRENKDISIWVMECISWLKSVLDYTE